MVKPNSQLLGSEHDDPSASAHWLATLDPYYSESDRARIAAACQLMLACRGGRYLDTGETEARQRLSSADILFGLRMDAETLCAALLNGCLERDGVTEAELHRRFGDGLTRMVVDLARIGQLTGVERDIAARDRLEQEENLRRLLLGIAADVRVVLVVLAERLHLMRVAKQLPVARQIKLADETHRVHAPLANRLGVWQIKWELEDLGLRVLEPDEYKRIAGLLRERRAERQGYIARVIEVLHGEFQRAGINASISGRPKHIYSIWRKMQRKRVAIDKIFDLRALRVLVDDIPACYAALGIVHGLWQHIPKEFDDYIATPKGNRYRSLHTAVIGPEDQPLEVQIRTHDMHRHAEFGVAAHWAYKEAKAHDAEFQRRVVWMRDWLETRGDRDQAALAREQAEFEPEHIYVLTPKAKVLELPKGATPLDFAYGIHSEIGHRCRGARVDGRIVTLNYVLSSGETVEILTQKNATPSRDWLSPHQGYMVTARARHRVRQWFKAQHFDRYVGEGRGLLDKEWARLGLEGKPPLDRLASRYRLSRGEDLLAAIGRGDLGVGQVLRPIIEARIRADSAAGDMPAPPAPDSAAADPAASRHADVIVAGVADLMMHFAPCCKPIPPEDIIGFVTRGRGISVHRRDCKNIQRLPDAERERLVEARWVQQPSEHGYCVDLIVVAADRRGLLRDVSSVFADDEANVTGVTTRTDAASDTARMRFTIRVRGIEQLERLIAKLRQLPDVLEVKRPR